jgi:hypothetical protein
MPDKLGRDFKSIEIKCKNGHEVAKYRKPKSEWGQRTHKLWLLEERLARLSTEPPILVKDPQTGEVALDIPETGTRIDCGQETCTLDVGEIKLVHGVVALELNKNNLRPTKG